MDRGTRIQIHGLLPVELWEYHFLDLVRGLSSTLGAANRPERLTIRGLGECTSIRSARAALVLAIQAIGLQPGSRIGVPLFCCPVVFSAITMAKCVPCFIDIDSRSFCVSTEDLDKKSPQLDALIVVHMFGNVCDMKAIRAIMQNKPIIEDCAQSLGSKLDGRPVGAHGDVAAFSFRSGKYLSAGEGGALFALEEQIRKRILVMVKSLPFASSRAEFLHIGATYLRSKLRSRPLWGSFGSRIWRFYNKKTDFINKSPITIAGIFRSDLAIIRHRMKRIDSMIESQRANADYYLRNLRLGPAALCREYAGAYYNRYAFPITFPTSAHRDFINSYLLSQQISTSKPYEDVPDGARKYYGYEGDCPRAEEVLKRVLVVPSHHQLSKKDIEHIVLSLNRGWANLARHPIE
jgi:perosamine synthetase